MILWFYENKGFYLFLKELPGRWFLLGKKNFFIGIAMLTKARKDTVVELWGFFQLPMLLKTEDRNIPE